MPDNERGRVIVLPTGYDPEGDEAPVKLPPRKEIDWSKPHPNCQHRRVTMVINEDDKAERLVCRDCDEQVPALDYVRRQAQDWQRYSTRVQEAQARAKAAEEESDRKIKEHKRRAAQATKMRAMPIGKRMARIAASIGRAQVALGDSYASLAQIYDVGTGLDPEWSLRAAEHHIARARAGLEKLQRDYGNGRRPAGAQHVQEVTPA